MVCQGCGASVVDGVHFCAKCGAPVPVVAPQYSPYPAPGAPMYMVQPRVQRHLQGLGMLWCVFAVYRFVTGLVGYFFLRAATSGSRWNFIWAGGAFDGTWMKTFYPIILTMALVMAGITLLVGYGLMTRQPWGRMLAIIIAIISLFKIPFGTVLGIYTLWVLAPGESAVEYEAIAGRG
jgi:zinc-ribbon domain